MKVGYARVSSKDQSLDIQRDKLSKHCEKVFEEKISGTKRDRPELRICLDFIRDGDILIITKLDRLARSMRHLQEILTILESKNVKLQVLDQNIDTTTIMGKLLFNIVGSIAEFETELRKERQMEGIENARAKGIYNRKKPKLNAEQVLQMKRMRHDGASVMELCKYFKIKKSTVYNYLKEEEDV